MFCSFLLSTNGQHMIHCFVREHPGLLNRQFSVPVENEEGGPHSVPQLKLLGQIPWKPLQVWVYVSVKVFVCV